MVESAVRTLLVEDNKDFRELVGHILRDSFPSMHVSEAGSCLDALEIMNDQTHDLIFMDINLPDGMGLDLTRTITNKFDQSVVVILTANDIPEYREASLTSGASRFMNKGNFTFQEIVDVVEDFISGRVCRKKLN